MNNDLKENYYDILNINKNASMDDIKKSYRQLALKYHPDRNNQNSHCKEIFQKINDAYNVLSNEQKRKEYDNQIFYKMSDIDLNKHVHDLFDNILSHHIEKNPMVSNLQKLFQHFIKPKPLKITVEISFEQSYNGTMVSIEYEKEIEIANDNIIMQKIKTYISIMKGIDDGEIIELKEKGNEIQRDGINYFGDLFITIKINPNEYFTRKGLDIFYLQNITLKEALVGFEIEIPHFNNKKLTIKTKKKDNFQSANENCQIVKPNQQMKIAGYGMVRNDNVGFLIITFNIIFPDTLSYEQIEKLVEIL